ncbi:MAG: outer membrane protein assembly factor [Bacteroidales bacterium]|jgi:outer membrane protein assembly factor BamA|nr:outer membrane protein assembly factor [Bacteroidales bacterium]
MNKVFLTMVGGLCCMLGLNAQNSTVQDSINEKQIATVAKPFKIGVLPVVSFDNDMGFQYGGLVNLYDHHHGYYPDYRQMVKIEISRYTKGSGINQLFYDAKNILPHHLRLTADFSYLTEQKLDFYGFNGYLSRYNPDITEPDNPLYETRAFYSHARKFLKFNADFQGQIHSIASFRWLAGFGLVNYKISSLDLDKLNKGKDEADKLPDVPTLYDKYVGWGMIPEAERYGGNANFLKTGLIYDTRDNEYAPERGLWTEALLLVSPKFFFNHFAYTKLVLTHRQYFTLSKNRLVLAVRLNYEGTIIGHAPFFVQPYMITSISSVNKSDGLGGAKTLRGVMRNRVVGDGIVSGIAELRYTFARTSLWKQNLAFSLNGFFDCGQVVQKVNCNFSEMSDNDKNVYFDLSNSSDRLHSGSGAGLRIALNHNFIFAVDYGVALDKRDGTSGLYINIGNLF